MIKQVFSKLILLKNNIILKLISFYDIHNKKTQIILPLIVIILSGLLAKIIINPIQFEKEKNYRYSFIKQKLIDIRSAELAYKNKHNQFTDDFDKLIPFVKSDSFVIVQKTDTLIEFYNKVYREYQFKDTMMIDTLGKVSILDSLGSINNDTISGTGGLLSE